MKLFSLFLLLIISFCSRASEMHDKAKEGVQHTEKLKAENQGSVLNPSNVNLNADIPGYSQYVAPSTLEDSDLKQAPGVASHDEHAKHIYDLNTKKDTSIKIDPVNDPLIRDSDALLKDPMKAIVGEPVEIVEEQEEITYEETKCEEARDPYSINCLEDRIVTVNTPPTQTYNLKMTVYSHGWSGGLSRNVITGQKFDSSAPVNGGGYSAWTSIQNPFPSSLGKVISITHVNPQWYTSFSNNSLSVTTSNGGWFHINYYYPNFDIVYQPLPTEKDIVETIHDGCKFLEENADKSICSYKTLDITQGPETRIINGLSVTRDWWQRRKTYTCLPQSKNNCEHLRARHCMQVGSKCLEYINKTCVNYEQTFKCPISKKLKVIQIKGGKAPFCIGGDCVTPSYTPNTELMEAISRLEFLKKIQDDLRANEVKIFDGKNPQKCSKYSVNFKDCCMKSKGWGVSSHLSQCSAEEQTLSKNRSKNLCVYVGTYCAEKVAGQCVRKKSSFCCFGSKIARIIHEQGRPQLGMSWGDAKHPQCRGFTADEIANLDFSKLDLSELYEELLARYKEKDLNSYVSQKPNLLQNIDTQIKLIQKELSLPKDKKPERSM
jgi:conjugal transfer mating pair stabilization protein TraN